MPEVLLELHWPDGEASRFYSPSTIIYNFLKPGETLSIAELEQKDLAALREASERVRARYGLGYPPRSGKMSPLSIANPGA
jgi:uncharacterized repeat protein (TIGR04042 family)